MRMGKMADILDRSFVWVCQVSVDNSRVEQRLCKRKSRMDVSLPSSLVCHLQSLYVQLSPALASNILSTSNGTMQTLSSALYIILPFRSVV